MSKLRESYDIFISYSRWDIDWAKDIINHLRQQYGWTCFFDTDMEVGEDHTIRLAEAINRSRVIVFCYDSSTPDSTWAKHEIQYAQRLGKPIIPVNLDDEEPQEWFRNLFPRPYISYGAQVGYGPGIPKILQALSEELGTPPSRDSIVLKKKCINASTDATDGPNVHLKHKVSLKKKVSDDFFEEAKLSVPKHATIASAAATTPSIWSNFFSRKNQAKQATVKLASDVDCDVFIDDSPACRLKNGELQRIYLNRGNYIVRFVETCNPQNYCAQSLSIADVDCDYSLCSSPTFHNRAVSETRDCTHKTIRCFIAGSTALKQERRSFSYVVSRIHNKWRSRNFAMESYSCEDFARAISADGQQQAYNDFIVEQADVVTFVFNEVVGGITLNEFRLAFDSFLQLGHPQIYVYSKKADAVDPSIQEVRDYLDAHGQYWVDYTDLDNLEIQVEHDLNWYLFDLFNKQ